MTNNAKRGGSRAGYRCTAETHIVRAYRSTDDSLAILTKAKTLFFRARVCKQAPSCSATFHSGDESFAQYGSAFVTLDSVYKGGAQGRYRRRGAARRDTHTPKRACHKMNSSTPSTATQIPLPRDSDCAPAPPSYTAAAGGAARQPRRLELSSLAARGTLLKHPEPTPPSFGYNAFDRGKNPCITSHDSSLLHVTLVPDSDCFYMAALEPQLLSRRDAADHAPAFEGRGVVSGTLRVVVKGPDALLLENVHVRLSGFCSEFARCASAGSATHSMRMVSATNCGTTPFVQDFIRFGTPASAGAANAASGPSAGLVLLPPGEYEYRFEFVVDAATFPASIETAYGSTIYRLEALVSMPKRKRRFGNKYESVFLTSAVTLKKALQHRYAALYQGFTAVTSLREEMLACDIFLSSRVVEFDSPLQVSLQMVKRDAQECQVLFTDVLVQQTLSIPCVDTATGVLEPTNFHQVQTVRLGNMDFCDEQQQCLNAAFPELRVPSTLKTIERNRSFFPHYEEPSLAARGLEPVRFKLRVAHELKIVIGVRINQSGDQQRPKSVRLTMKFPIALVDPDMGCCVNLPRYEPKSPIPLPSGLCKLDSDSAPSTPPEYLDAEL